MPIYKGKRFVERLDKGDEFYEKRIKAGQRLVYGLYNVNYHDGNDAVNDYTNELKAQQPEYRKFYAWGKNRKLPVLPSDPTDYQYLTHWFNWYDDADLTVVRHRRNGSPFVFYTDKKDLDLYAKWRQKKFQYSGRIQYRYWVDVIPDVPGEGGDWDPGSGSGGGGTPAASSGGWSISLRSKASYLDDINQYFTLGWQCTTFVYFRCHDATGYWPPLGRAPNYGGKRIPGPSEWVNSRSLSSLKAGDVIVMSPDHVIFVEQILPGGNITISDTYIAGNPGTTTMNVSDFAVGKTVKGHTIIGYWTNPATSSGMGHR